MPGPNVTKLIRYKMSVDAIPPGAGFQAGIDFLRTPQRIAESAKASEQWVSDAIAALRQAAKPNPYADMPDEEIAAVILASIQQRLEIEHLLHSRKEPRHAADPNPGL
jgi:hypothetical protein